MIYKFAIDEVTTKINISREEFTHLHAYNPIEHVNTRLKTAGSIMARARHRDCARSLDEVRESICDVAGVRLTSGFVSDVYTIFDLLTARRMSR